MLCKYLRITLNLGKKDGTKHKINDTKAKFINLCHQLKLRESDRKIFNNQKHKKCKNQ